MDASFRLLGALLVVAAGSQVSTAQSSRETTMQLSPAATAEIAGTVVTVEATPRPVRRAIVTVVGADQRQSTITTDDGRFRFANLPTGQFSVSATKASYLTTEFGAKRPGRPGTPVSLAAGQQLTGLVLGLSRGAVLSGIVRGEDGEPAAGVQVHVLPAGLLDSGGPPPTPAAQVTTDDLGIYRAFGLMPGQYLIAATMTVTGPSGQIGVRSTSDVDTLLATLRSPGRGASAGRAVGPSSSPSPSPAYGHAPIYYPGTPVAAEAARVTVAAAEERDGLDFTVSLVPAATVEGTISDPSGAIPTGAQLTLTARGPLFPPSFMQRGLSQQADALGQFKFIGVTPGDYTLSGRMMPRLQPGETPPAFPSMSWATADVHVSGQDVLGIALALQPGMTLSGRVAFDATALAPPADLTRIQIGLIPGDGSPATPTFVSYGVMIGRTSVSPVQAKTDGTFVLSGIMPGTYRFSVTPLGTAAPGWWLRSALVNDQDVLDVPLEFSGSSIAGAVLTFSDRHTELSGKLTSPAGQPAPGYFVIVFPADQKLWRSGSRRVQGTRPSSDGLFRVEDLPPGEYQIAALSDVEPNAWNDPTFLEALASASVKVTIADGGHVKQDIQIKRP
jgi:hypothetical protein